MMIVHSVPASILSQLCRASETPFALIGPGDEVLGSSPGFGRAGVELGNLPDGWITWPMNGARAVIGLPGTEPSPGPLVLDAPAVGALQKALDRTLLAASALPSKRKQGELVGTLEESASQLRVLTQVMAKLAAMEAGRIQLAEEDFDLENCLRGVLAQHSSAAAVNARSLRLEGAQDLPVTVCCDRGRLCEVLHYLVGSALEAVNGAEGGPVVLGVTLAQAGRMKIEVRESGGGHSPAHLELGSWLDRCLATHTVEALGGTLEQKALAGVGSRACFELNYSSPSRIHVQWGTRSSKGESKSSARSSVRSRLLGKRS